MKSQKLRSLLFLLDDHGILYRMGKQSNISTDPVIAWRLRAINHQIKYGYLSACDAFQIGKTTLYRWRKTYFESGKQAVFLKRKSTKPFNVRQMATHPLLIGEVKRLRQQYYRLGKEKIKPLLEQFCLEHKLPIISVSTIGKVIKRHNLFYQKQRRVYHNPSSKQGQRTDLLRKKRARIKHAWQTKELGHLQMDTIVKFSDSMKRYAISVMDINSKFTLSLVYPSLNSTNALDALEKFRQVYPIVIKSVQTDNGLEFLGVFDHYLQTSHITHYFTYPRCPKINGFIERYNRTFQDEFLDSNLHLFSYPKEFYGKLLKYLIFFNTKRVHKALGNQTPMNYLLSKGLFSQMCVTYTLPRHK